MNIYITFGQVHTHRVNNQTFDCNSVALIVANTHEEGRQRAVEAFGLKFCRSFTELEEVSMSFYPRGVIPLD